MNRHHTQTLAALAVIAPVVIATAGAQWHARPEAIAQANKQQPGFNYDESRVESYTLPDLLVWIEGGKVNSPSTWREQRADILNLFRTNVYGRSPGRPEHVAFSTI